MAKQDYFDTDYSGRPLTNRTFTDEQRRNEDPEKVRQALLRAMDRIVVFPDGTEAALGPGRGQMCWIDPKTGIPDIDNPVAWPGFPPDNQ